MRLLPRWLEPPRLEDREAQRLAASVYSLALLFAGIAVAWSVLAALLYVEPGAVLGNGLAAVAVLAVAAVLARRGWVRTAAWVFVGQLFAVTCLGLVAEGGITGPAASNFLVTVIAAGLLLSGWAAVGVALAAAAALALGAAAEVQGLLPAGVPATRPRAWVAEVTLIGAGLALVRLTLARLGQAHAALGASEARFRALAEHAPDLVAEIGEDGRILYANPAHEAQLGRPVEELVGHRPTEFVPSSDREGPRRVAESLGTGEWVRDTWRVLRADGTARWYEFDAIRYAAPEGGDRTIALGRDVTERRDMEERLRRAEKMEALGQLAGGVAHDFNNYLTVILGSAELLADEVSGEPARAALEDLRAAARRSSDLTRQLMAFSRHRLLRPRVVDLNAVLRRVEPLLRRLLPAPIAVEMRLDPGPTRVRVDPAQIEQVVLNLAVNARDAMPEGGHLTLETRTDTLDAAGAAAHPELEPGPHVALSVTDTGAGVEPEVLARIFEPLFTTKSRGAGTGLGLATVEAIVRQSGGGIRVESTPGAGSVFRILLPAVDAPLEAEEAEREPPEALAGSEAVLLVEDDAMVRGFARRALEAHGYRVQEAADAEAALGLLESGVRPDLVISDVVLPGASGLELAERIADRAWTPRVLLISGYARNSLAEHGLDPKSAVLDKPFTARTLLTRVREVLDAPD